MLNPGNTSFLRPSKTLISTNFMKGSAVIFVFAATSLIYYSIFSNQKWLNCSQCNRWFTAAGNDYHKLDDEKTNITHILFGIGGSAKTWNERRQYCEIWWRPNYTRGFVWLDKKPPDDSAWPEASPPYKVSQDTSRFKYTCWYGSRSAIRIARIVKESFVLGLENVRWFVMGDDDTVFFPENLVTVLGKYDHNQMYYIGGNSESVEQDVLHSYTMGYGGGGFAISYPLAAELVRVLDRCIDRYASFYGSDEKIGACMSEIGVPLTKELGFHQVDIRGSPYGLLAAHPLAPLVSLHHLDYVHPLFSGMNRIDSVKKLIEAYNADPNRIVQHSLCYDLIRKSSISVSWGYTVQLYPTLVSAKDLGTTLQTFLSWKSWSEEPFTFNTRPMSLEPCERPVIYFFDGVRDLGNGQTLTSYKRPTSEMMRKQCGNQDYASAYKVKMFNVTAPTFDPDLWKKAPHRQCCEMVTGSEKMEGVVQVRIRGCN